MHSVGLNTHGNPHLTARGLQQPESTTPVNPIPSADDEGEGGSFGAAVKVTLSAEAKAHMGLTSKGNQANSSAHQARGLMLEAGFASAGVPFGKLVSEIARMGIDSARSLFVSAPEPVEESVAEDESGEGTTEVALAPQPVPPLEDLLLEEELLGPIAVEPEPSFVEELLDPDADDQDSTAV